MSPCELGRAPPTPSPDACPGGSQTDGRPPPRGEECVEGHPPGAWERGLNHPLAGRRSKATFPTIVTGSC